MKMFRTIGLLAVACMTAMSAAAFNAIDHVAIVWQGLKAFAADITIRILAGVPETDPGAKTASLRGFVKAKAFVLRQIKREQPRVEASWRLCPSA